MNKPINLWLGVGFFVSFFWVGIPFWQVPYSKVSLPDTLYNTGLVIVGVAAASSRLFGKARLRRAILITGAAVPAAVIARIIIETSIDPTSHNLLPFEIIIAVFVGLSCSLPGALIGSLTARMYNGKNITGKEPT